MKHTIYLALALFLSSCSDYDYRISDLKNEKIKFDDLPQMVADHYQFPGKFEKVENGVLEDETGFVKLVCLGQSCSYDVKAIDTWIGPWIAYIKLTDIGTGVSYRIERGTPYPYVVHKNKLYLLSEYSLSPTDIDHSALEITCYTLKDK